MKTWDRVRLNDKDWIVAAYEPSSKHSGRRGEVREIVFGPTGGSAVAEHVKTLRIAYNGEVPPRLLAFGTRFYRDSAASWIDRGLLAPNRLRSTIKSEFRAVIYDLASLDLYFGVTGTAVMRVKFLSDCDLYAHVEVALYQERST